MCGGGRPGARRSGRWSAPFRSSAKATANRAPPAAASASKLALGLPSRLRRGGRPATLTARRLPALQLDVDPSRVGVGEVCEALNNNRGQSIVDLLQGAAPYIELHQSSTMVIHIASEVLNCEVEKFQPLMDDIATLHILGVKLVVVVSVRAQVDARLAAARGGPCEPAWRTRQGARVTGPEALAALQIEVGLARSKVEAAMAKGLRNGRQLSDSLTMGVDVVGGNGMYTAQPLGVVQGVDMQQTGAVRHVFADKIRRHLDAGEIVLLSALAYTAAGETFNVMTEDVAARAAPALDASKLIFITAGRESLVYVDDPGTEVDIGIGLVEDTAVRGNRRIASMRLANAQQLLLRSDELRSSASSTEQETLLQLVRSAVDALERGVNRAHFVPPVAGALLNELYTRDGAGTLICRDIYEGIRRASVADVKSMLALIEPLERDGTLVARDRDALVADIKAGCYYVLARDNLPIACAMLKRLDTSGRTAELGCLVVRGERGSGVFFLEDSEGYRQQAKGDAMLSYLERVAIAANVQYLFALSTKTMHWFVERGFEEVAFDALPESRRTVYDTTRKPKIYRKELKSERHVDSEDAFWTGKLRAAKSGGRLP